MKRLVLDTNTLIAAIGWKASNSRKILDSCIGGQNLLVESIDLLSEFSKVLERPKFGFIEEQDKQEFLKNLLSISLLVSPTKKLDVIKDDPDDNIVLECAVQSNADYIISGDNHLLSIHEYSGVKIKTPKWFVDNEL